MDPIGAHNGQGGPDFLLVKWGPNAPYLSRPCGTAFRRMSRPQFDRYAHHAAADAPMHYGPVVNGGLIDFQDNLQRGVCPDYAGQQNLGFNGYAPVPLQQAYQVAPPNVAQPASLLPGQAGVIGGCFSGPPSFIHVNGVTYKPVEGAASAVDPRAAPATLAPQPQTGDHAANMRPLTEDELYQAIDTRVSDKVGEYVSRKLRHYQPPKEAPTAHNGRNEEQYRDSPGGTHARASRHNPAPAERDDMEPRSRAPRHNNTALVERDDVDAAVQRIMQANAQISSPGSSASRSSRVPLW